jgi:hypothetical protein
MLEKLAEWGIETTVINLGIPDRFIERTNPRPDGRLRTLCRKWWKRCSPASRKARGVRPSVPSRRAAWAQETGLPRRRAARAFILVGAPTRRGAAG